MATKRRLFMGDGVERAGLVWLVIPHIRSK